MKHIYNPRHDDEGFTVKEFMQELNDLEYNGLDLTKIYYSYDLLGFLHTFRKTAKGVSCHDSLGNYCYFRETDKKFRFYKINFMYEEGVA